MALVKNEFIIGLGGVGGRSVQAFRRTCKIRKADTDQLKADGGKFEYLYIDSNDDIASSSGWEIYGEDISLLPSEIIKLKEGVDSSVSQIAKQENIAPWLGNLSEHFSKRARGNAQSTDTQLQGLEGAGQLRRFGRALFARQTSRIRNVISAKINDLQNGRERAINFRIFCTLGGGTGSGSLIDMITMLRTMARDRGFEAHIYVYPFVAGAAAEASNAGSFYENEYATLRDLNALMTGRYHPYVVGRVAGANQGNNFENDSTPIKQVFLSSELAPGSPKLEQQVDYMAKACFDAIVYTCGKSKETNCLKAFSGEDLVDVHPGEPEVGQSLRSYRFSAFGARRWCVPTAQIKELLKYDSAKRVMECWLHGAPLAKGLEHRDMSVLLQTSFNLKNGAVFAALAKKTEELMTPLKQQLDSIEKNNQRAPQVLASLRQISDNIVDATRALMGDSLVLAKLEPCYEKDADAIFKNIQSGVDRVITWKAAVGDAWGLLDVQKFLGFYMKEISSWPAELLTGSVPSPEHDDDIVKNMKNREEEWQKLGFLTIHLTHMDEDMISWQAEDAERRVAEAYMAFRKLIIENLCERVASKMTTLKSRVDSAVRDLQNKLQSVENKIGQYETDLTSNTSGSFGDMYEYDAENLRKLREAMGGQKRNLQEVMASTYSPEWAHNIGSLADYTSAKMDTLCHIVESRLTYTTSKEMHDRACQNGEVQPVLVSSIIDRLAQIAGPEESLWRERLRPRIKEFLMSIGSSVELSGKGTGLRSPQVSPSAALCIGFPRSSANAQLCQWLQNELKNNIPTEYSVMAGRTDTYTHSSDHEIRVLYVPYWFPARFASVVKVIFDKYVDSSQSEEGPMKTYFANIDDVDNGLDSKTRPALTQDGDPDRKNEAQIEIAKKLFARVGEETTPILDESKDGIKLLKSVDGLGVPQYSQTFPLSMRTMPSSLFKTELENALTLAKDSMTPDDKTQVVTGYANILKRMRKDGINPASEEFDAQNQLYQRAQALLGLL